MKLLFAALLTAATTQVLAAPDGQALAAQHNCLGCHQVASSVVGPAYKDVAARYRGNKAAVALLSDRIRKGGIGVWGKTVPMPAQQVSDADLKVIVTWILGLK